MKRWDYAAERRRMERKYIEEAGVDPHDPVDSGTTAH